MQSSTGSYPQTANPVLKALAHAIHAIQRRTADPARRAAASARTLRLFLGHPELLTAEQRQSDPERYRQHVLYVPEDGAFSIVALVWRPGQATAVHDHVAWCAVGVHEGREEEIAYDLVEHEGRSCLLRGERQLFAAGTATSLVPPATSTSSPTPAPATPSPSISTAPTSARPAPASATATTSPSSNPPPCPPNPDAPSSGAIDTFFRPSRQPGFRSTQVVMQR